MGYGAVEGEEANIAIMDMADETGVDDPEAEINKLKAKLYDLEQKYPGQPRDHGRFSFGRGATSNPPLSSNVGSPKPTNSDNVQVAVTPIQGIGWPSMNDALPQNAILSGGEANVKPQTVRLEGNDQYKIKVQEEDARGGYIKDHIDQSYDVLMSQSGVSEIPIKNEAIIAEGTFASEQDAEYYINEVLQMNKEKLDKLVDEQEGRVTLIHRFGHITGKEFYSQSDGKSIESQFRNTHAITVVAKYAENSPRGYTVITAYPMNLRKSD